MLGMEVMEPEEIKEIINNAKSVALVLDENPGEKEVLGREALRIFFQNKGTPVYLFPENPEEIKNKWSVILENNNNHKNASLSGEISVRVPKERFDIKEINYEEDEEFLTLKITADDNENRGSDISVEIKPMTFDILICVGSPDANFNNYKNKISLMANDKTLSEKIFEITGDEVSPNLLFTSLLLETSGFKRGVTEGSLNLGQRLLSLGADKKIIDEILNSELSLSVAQILGRALARTRFSESPQSNWTFISKNDFEKTGVSDIDISLVRRISEEIKEIVPPQPTFIILWENGENMVQALITRDGNGEKQAGPYKNFTEAEMKIKQMLK
jgi:hypothetical protein